MSNTRREDTINYMERMRWANFSESLAVNTVLMEKTDSICKDNGCNIDDIDGVYDAMRDAAKALDVPPVRDRNLFYTAYRIFCELSANLDLEYLFFSDRRNKGLGTVSDAIYKEFEARFREDARTVLVADASNFVPNLRGLVTSHPNCHFTLTDANPENVTILKLILSGCYNVRVLNSNVYTYGFIEERFDQVLCVPAFGGRTLAEDPNFMCKELDCVALENLLLHTAANGELLIAMAARITFAQGKNGELRRFIEQNYKLKEVDELPEGTFPGIGIKTVLLNIVNARVSSDDDIIVRKYASAKSKKRQVAETLEVEKDTFVMPSELEEQGDWSTSKIFALQDEELTKYQSSTVRRVALSEVAEVFRGKAITQKDPSGAIAVLNISDIGEFEIDYDNLDHIEEEERRVHNYILQEGDVVLPARGTAIRSAVFHQQSYPCIASSNIIVIRPNSEDLNSDYLKLFLGSPVGKKMIAGIQQGATIINVSYKDLKELEVPVPTIEEQMEKVEEYKSEYEKYTSAVKSAQDRWSAVLTRLYDFS